MIDDGNEPRKNGWTGGQHSLWRAALGLVLAWMAFDTLADTLGATGLSGGVAAIRREGSFQLGSAVVSGVGALAILGGLGAACVAFAIGWRDRWLAILVATVLAASRLPFALAWSIVPWQTLFLLVVHAMLPSAPYGSLDARGRADSGGGWRAPELVRHVLWIGGAVIAAALLAPSFADFFGPDGIASAGSLEDWPRIARGLGNPMVDLLGASAAIVNVRVTQAWAATVLLLPLAAPFRRARPFAWCVLAAVDLAACVVGWRFDAAIAIVALELVLLFDPAWIRARDPGATERFFYDGECGLCLRSVRFVLAEDASGRAFRFAPLQGETFARAIDREVRAKLPDSVVVLASDGSVLVRSDAAMHVLERLGGLWRVLGTLARVVPRPLRDAAYDVVASGRKRLFAKPSTACPLGPRHVAERFDP